MKQVSLALALALAAAPSFAQSPKPISGLPSVPSALATDAYIAQQNGVTSQILESQLAALLAGTGLSATGGTLAVNCSVASNCSLGPLASFTPSGTATTLLHGNASGAPSWGSVNLTTDVSGTLPAGNLPAATTGAAGIVQFGTSTGQALQGGTAISNVPSLGMTGPLSQTAALSGTSASGLTLNSWTINDTSSITGSSNAVGDKLTYNFNGTGVEQSWGRIGRKILLQVEGPSCIYTGGATCGGSNNTLAKQYVGFAPGVTLAGGQDGGIYTTAAATCAATCTSLQVASLSQTQAGYTWTMQVGDPVVVLMDSGGVGPNHASPVQTITAVNSGTSTITITPGLASQASSGAVVMDINGAYIWGENPVANQANALFATSVAGSEVDAIINGNAGEHAWWRYGYAAVSQGTGNASAYDIAFDVGGSYNLTNGTVGWTTGLGFEDRRGNGQAPINPNGTLIATLGSWTVKNEVDFSSITCTGDAWLSTGFQIGCGGGLNVGNIAGGALLSIGPLSGGGSNAVNIDFHRSGNSGADVRLAANGSDGTGNDDGDFEIFTSGNIIIGKNAALSNAYTTGGLYLPFTAGTPTGTQTNAQPSITYNKATHTINIYDVSGFYHITATAGAG